MAVGVLAILPLPFLSWYNPSGRGSAGRVGSISRPVHPLAVHLPIALLLLVPLLELAALIREREHLRKAAEFVLGLATVAAIASACLGWLLAWSGGYEGSLVTRHMWGGLCLASASLICWVLRQNHSAYLVMLLSTIGLLTWTSDQGGKLTHGENFLTEHSTGKLQAYEPIKTQLYQPSFSGSSPLPKSKFGLRKNVPAWEVFLE